MDQQPGKFALSDVPNERAVFEPDVLLQRVGGDVELRNEILNMIEGELARLVDALERSLSQNDAAQVERMAHTLKGALGNLGSIRGSEVALRVEHLGRNGDIAAANAEFANLKELVRRVGIAVVEFKSAHSI